MPADDVNKPPPPPGAPPSDCGGVGQRPCPPEPASTAYADIEANDVPYYTRDQMLAYGQQCADWQDAESLAAFTRMQERKANGPHAYTSNACHHARHQHCTMKCSFCPARCLCSCHGEAAVEAIPLDLPPALA
jgi:hypothetical protein